MPEVLAATDLPGACKAPLIKAAAVIIGPKRHRILHNKTSHSPIFEAFVLLTYNDQESHLNFTAVPTEAGCEVSYRESFEINTPCIDAREALFKRWQVLGKLSDTTMVLRYDSPRKKEQLPADEDDRATAYLTQTRQGVSCLVTKKQQHIQSVNFTK
ncbi:MAG: hypothetical protein CR975_06500 [Gammaproteobacteria bacterium]|nr:MAG: hypothetical protein CR975_06500 [Gammaproteobacteria bacterium]